MGNRWGNWKQRQAFLGGSKITADGHCSHEIKRCLLLGKKAMTNLDSMLKSRDVTLPTKVHLVKAMVFPVVMYGCESWTIMKAECWRIDAFELWCWRRLLRVPWTARRSNQSILGKISPECSLERLMLKLKLQYVDHQMQRADSLEKTLMQERLKAGGGGDDRGWDAAAAAAAAKCLPSYLTLCDPVDGSPPGSSVPGILQAEYWSGVPLSSPQQSLSTAKKKSVFNLYYINL